MEVLLLEMCKWWNLRIVLVSLKPYRFKISIWRTHLVLFLLRYASSRVKFIVSAISNSANWLCWSLWKFGCIITDLWIISSLKINCLSNVLLWSFGVISFATLCFRNSSNSFEGVLALGHKELFPVLIKIH